MTQVELRLFGMPRMAVDQRSVHFSNRKAIALIAYLVATGKPYTREHIAALLWPENEQALANLRNAFYELSGKAGKEHFEVSRQSVALSSHPDFWSDVGEYLALSRARSANHLTDEERVHLLKRAVELYQGDFMAGFSLRDSAEYDQWQSIQATYFLNMQKQLSLELVTLVEASGNVQQAIQFAEDMRALDPLDDEAGQALMQLYLRAGQTQSVIRLYEEIRSAYQTEYDSPPPDWCTALYREAVAPTHPQVKLPATGPLATGNIRARIFLREDQITLGARKYIGREDLIADALRLMQDQERLLLAGMGGIGKTSTAASIARSFIKATGKAVVWLETGFQQTTEILLALASAFDQQQSIVSQADPAAFIMNLIAEKSGLLVLDNCWNSAVLYEILRAVPFSLPVIITSRQRFPIDGQVITVDLLNEDQARSLLTYHAGRHLPDSDEVMNLLHLLGRHPYALEIAGKQLKAQGGLQVRDLVKRYSRRISEIKVPGGFGESGRQSIEDIIATSIDVLDPDTRALLVQFGNFAARRVSLDLLSLVLDCKPEALETPLAQLEQGSLIETLYEEEPALVVYQLHDLIYGYCRDLFRTSGGDRSDLVRGVGEYVRRFSHDVLRMEAEFTNILGAIRAAIQANEHEVVIELVRALMADGYFAARGYTPELLEHLNTAIQFAREIGEPVREKLHYLHSKRADVYQMQAKLDDAFQEYLEALGTAPDASRRALVASILGSLAFKLKREEYPLYLDEAESVARTHHLTEILSRLMENRGYIAFASRDPLRARYYFEEAVLAAEDTGLPNRIFYTLYNLSVIEIELQNYASAERNLARALLIVQSCQNELWYAMYCSCLGRCTHARDDRPQTLQLMMQALDIYERQGDADAAHWVREFLATGRYLD